MQFTTGTTGRPKGVRVLLTHRDPVANACRTALAHLVRAGIVLRETPGNHDGDGPLHAIAARADERLAPFGRIRLTEACDAVPRTPTGEPARALVRTRLRARAAVGPFTPTP